MTVRVARRPPDTIRAHLLAGGWRGDSGSAEYHAVALFGINTCAELRVAYSGYAAHDVQTRPVTRDSGRYDGQVAVGGQVVTVRSSAFNMSPNRVERMGAAGIV